jgi:O-antigen/teichoic acid export membrane protein
LSTAKKFAGQTAVYGVSTIASRVLTFFLTPVYTGAYVTAAYGVITTLYSYISIINALLAFGMETTFFRYLNKHPDNKQRVYNNAFASIFVVTILFLLFTIPFAGWLAGYIDVNRAATLAAKGQHPHTVLGTTYADFLKYVYICLAIVIVDAWCAIPFAKLRADGKPARYGLIKLASVLVFVTFNLIFIYVVPFWLKHNLGGSVWISGWFMPRWVGYVFVSELLSSIVTLLLLLPQLLQIRFNFDKEMLLSMYRYSWPVLIANLSYLVNENMDKILLGKMLPSNISLHDVGVYGACSKIAVFLSIFVNAFRLGAEPFFFNHAKNKNATQTYARIMDYFVITVCVIFIALIANIDWLKYFIRNQSYWTGLAVVPPLLFGYVSLGIYMNLSIWYKLSDQTKYGLYISGVGAILTIVLNVIFIPKYSYMASAWVSLIAYTVMMILSYIWGQKNYPIPYDLKKNLAYILSSIVIVYFITRINGNYQIAAPVGKVARVPMTFGKAFFIGDGLLLGYILAAFYFERANLKAIFKR